MREWAFEIHKGMRERKLLKPGKRLIWQQGCREVEYLGGDGIMVISLRVELGTWAPSIAKEHWNPEDIETAGHEMVAETVGILLIAVTTEDQGLTDKTTGASTINIEASDTPGCWRNPS